MRTHRGRSAAIPEPPRPRRAAASRGRFVAACGALAAIASWSAAPALARQDESPVTLTLSLSDADLATVLESFAVKYRMNIVSGPEVRGKVTMNLFDVPVEDALARILEVNGLRYRRSGTFYLIEPIAAEAAPAAAEEPSVETEVYWLDYLRAEEALRLIEPLKSTRGTFTAGSPAETGIDSDPARAGGDSPAGGEVLVLRDEPAVLEEVRAVLRKIDRRPRQVLVEATILQVDLDDETSLGVDFNSIAGVDFTDLGAISGFDSLLAAPAGPAVIGDGAAALGTSGFAGANSADGVHFGLVTSNVAAFIEALETVTDATVLANPRVLAVDRQRAEIIIGAKLGFKTATTTETATVQEVEFLDIGTQLRFRPFISGDGYVRLEIHPENSTGVIDPATGLPSETTTEVTTNVLVKDGNTIAIGGLISDQTETSVRQIPGLGSIPWVGGLFRRTTDRVQRTEIVVLLTPHIVDGGAPDDSLDYVDDLARARDATFLRQLPVSRTRLATPRVEAAERALAAGQYLDALRLAECALDLTPADVRAVRARTRALAGLGLADEETRALEVLGGR